MEVGCAVGQRDDQSLWKGTRGGGVEWGEERLCGVSLGSICLEVVTGRTCTIFSNKYMVLLHAGPIKSLWRKAEE